MNYIILLILISRGYYLANLKNKSTLFLVLLLGVYIYYERLVPDSFWQIPQPLYKESFEFGKLEELVNKYNKGSLEEDIILKNKIQKEINTIYFSFPNHLHPNIDKYLYQHYGFIKS